MKSIRIIFFSLAIAIIALSYGCQSAPDLKPAESQAPQVQEQSAQVQKEITPEEKAIAKLKKELDGFSDELGALDKKLREQDLGSQAAMSKKAELDQQLMQLRKGAWQARRTIVSGDIQDGEAQIGALREQLDVLMKEAETLGSKN